MVTSSEHPTSDGLSQFPRWAHEFQKASGSREMVEANVNGEWMRYDDFDMARYFIIGYLKEHKGFLSDLGAHPNIVKSVQYIIDEINKL